MTPEDLDAFRRADPGYHYDDGEPCPLPLWAIALLIFASVGVALFVVWMV